MSHHQPRNHDEQHRRSQDNLVHSGVHCDGCSGAVEGFRYKCIKQLCPDFDLCSSCENEGLHSDHFMVRIPTPTPRHDVSKLYVAMSAAMESQRQRQNHDELHRRSQDTLVHPGITCDCCFGTVEGFRYKCINQLCPDFDLCSSCENKGLHSDHFMVRIPTPTPSVDVRKRCVELTAAIESQRLRQNRERHLHSQVYLVHSGVHCDGCFGAVEGFRYKCIDQLCPDFDLCSSCENKRLHSDHFMVRIPTPTPWATRTLRTFSQEFVSKAADPIAIATDSNTSATKDSADNASVLAETVWSCPVCIEKRSENRPLGLTHCGHLFCKECILECIERSKECPMCRGKLTKQQITPFLFSGYRF